LTSLALKDPLEKNSGLKEGVNFAPLWCSYRKKFKKKYFFNLESNMALRVAHEHHVRLALNLFKKFNTIFSKKNISVFFECIYTGGAKNEKLAVLCKIQFFVMQIFKQQIFAKYIPSTHTNEFFHLFDFFGRFLCYFFLTFDSKSFSFQIFYNIWGIRMSNLRN